MAIVTALPDAAWRRWPELRRLLRALSPDGAEVRVVGGAVRDTLAGLPVADVDLATPLTPDTVMARLEAAGIKAIPTGIAHGTVTAVCDGRRFEVTTLRRDVATDGRRATVAFADDWQQDAARRDFTINALYADAVGGVVFDFFGGRADLDAGIVRFIGDPAQRIAEDHLRILRYYRFAARFGRGAPDAASHAAVVAARSSLRTLSRERVADELLKLLGLPGPAAIVRQILADGIIAEILPEVDGEASARLDRLLANESAAGATPDALRRLAALLPGPDAAAAVGARLRLSNRQRAALTALTQWRTQIAALPVRHLAYRSGAAMARDAWLLAGTADDQPDVAAALSGWEPPRFPVKGGALVALGVAPGPDVARLMQAAEADWIAAGFPDHFDVARWLQRALRQ